VNIITVIRARRKPQGAEGRPQEALRVITVTTEQDRLLGLGAGPPPGPLSRTASWASEQDPFIETLITICFKEKQLE